MPDADVPETWVVIPAYREERLIGRAIAQVPSWVARIVVVDDASPDGTAEAARRVADPRVEVVRRSENGGVGAAIVDGYRRFLEGTRFDDAVCVVMAGDAQMDPADLPALIATVAEGVDYAKGNRFMVRGTFDVMPVVRFLGNRFLSALTAKVTGYAVGDSQCGYTAVTRRALLRVPLDRLYARYGFPNDMLVKAAAAGWVVADVPVRAVYADEVSGLSPWKVGPRILGILWRGRREIAAARREGVRAGSTLRRVEVG